MRPVSSRWLAVTAAAALAGCNSGSGGGNPGGGSPADTTPPSVPTELTASASAAAIDVSWRASTDDRGVSFYHVFRDGTHLASATTTSFEDGAASHGVPHCYAVSAYDAAGNVSPRSAAECATIPDQPPVARLDGPASELTGVAVTFDAGSSTDADGTIVRYAFDFGDGTPALSQSAPIAAHVFAAAGTYPVSVVVTDDLGARASATRRITIGLVLSAPVNVSNTPTWSQGPSMSRDPTGNLAAVWEESGSNILFSRSTNGGLSFSPATPVVDPNGPLGSANGFDSEQGQVVSTAGAIHVAWTLFDTSFGGAEILHARSTDGGATFDTLRLVSSDDGVNSYGPMMAADEAGNVAIVWSDTDLSTGAVAIWHRGSADGGATFSPPQALARSGACPRIALSGSNRYVAWMVGSFGAEQVLFSRSTDGGASFSEPVALSVAGKSWCPVVETAPDGSIHVAWLGARKILLTRSTDGGATFTAPAELSGSADADSVSLASVGTGRLFVAWSTLVDGALRDDFLVVSSDGGTTFGAPLLIPAPTGHGLVPRADDELGLFWSSDDRDIYHRVATLSVP